MSSSTHRPRAAGGRARPLAGSSPGGGGGRPVLPAALFGLDAGPISGDAAPILLRETVLPRGQLAPAAGDRVVPLLGAGILPASHQPSLPQQLQGGGEEEDEDAEWDEEDEDEEEEDDDEEDDEEEWDEDDEEEDEEEDDEEEEE